MEECGWEIGMVEKSIMIGGGGRGIDLEEKKRGDFFNQECKLSDFSLHSFKSMKV